MKEKRLGSFQFQREKAKKGESNKKYYTEIAAESLFNALMKIKNIGIDNLNWRWIDSYDSSDCDYDEIEFACVESDPVGFKHRPLVYDQDLFYAPRENIIFIRTYLIENNQIYCKIEENGKLSIKEFDNTSYMTEKHDLIQHVGKIHSILDVMGENQPASQK